MANGLAIQPRLSRPAEIFQIVEIIQFCMRRGDGPTRALPQSIMQHVALDTTSSSVVEDLLSDAGMQNAVQRQVEQWIRLLQHVRDHGNVALACATEGLPRPTYYRVWRQFKLGGIPGLSRAARRSIERSPGFRAQVDAAVVDLSRSNPTWGRHRLSKALQSQGKDISARQVWCVWKRQGMLDRSELIENTELGATRFDRQPMSDRRPLPVAAAAMPSPLGSLGSIATTDTGRAPLLPLHNTLRLLHVSSL